MDSGPPAAPWGMASSVTHTGIVIRTMADPVRRQSCWTSSDELEAFTTSDQIDEHYLYVKGGFGTLKLGADDAAHYLLGGSAPGGLQAAFACP